MIAWVLAALLAVGWSVPRKPVTNIAREVADAREIRVFVLPTRIEDERPWTWRDLFAGRANFGGIAAESSWTMPLHAKQRMREVLENPRLSTSGPQYRWPTTKISPRRYGIRLQGRSGTREFEIWFPEPCIALRWGEAGTGWAWGWYTMTPKGTKQLASAFDERYASQLPDTVDRVASWNLAERLRKAGEFLPSAKALRIIRSASRIEVVLLPWDPLRYLPGNVPVARPGQPQYRGMVADSTRALTAIERDTVRAILGRADIWLIRQRDWTKCQDGGAPDCALRVESPEGCLEVLMREEGSVVELSHDRGTRPPGIRALRFSGPEYYDFFSAVDPAFRTRMAWQSRMVRNPLVVPEALARRPGVPLLRR